MWFASLLAGLKSRSSRTRTGRGRHPKLQHRRPFVPRFEVLEGRTLPSTFTVLNNTDHDDGSLRPAITAAASGDTINFDPSLAGQTITLTSGELAINKSLDIEGLGANRLTISGNDASRIFDVTDAGVTVTLAGLTISHGQATEGAGIDN